MDKKLLAICIPTYNRADVLDESLGSLMSIIDDRVKIIVIDNNSTDNTFSIASKYRENILYLCNETNIGGDLNILKCYKVASEIADYICVLGDSYRISKSSLDSILSHILTFKYHLIINAQRATGFHTKVYHNADDVLRDVGGAMDLTGTIIIKSEAVSDSYYLKYIHTHFIHFGMSFDYIASVNNLNCLFLSEHPILFTTLNRNHNWYKNSIEIFAKEWVRTILLLDPIYTRNSREICMKAHDKFTKIFHLRNFLLLRLNKSISWEIIKRNKLYIKKTSSINYWLVLLISSIPVVFLRLILNPILKFKNKFMNRK